MKLLPSLCSSSFILYNRIYAFGQILGRNLERPFKMPAGPAQKIVESVESTVSVESEENSPGEVAQGEDGDEATRNEEEDTDDEEEDDDDGDNNESSDDEEEDNNDGEM